MKIDLRMRITFVKNNELSIISRWVDDAVS